MIIDNKYKLYSCDFESLYTNIDSNDASHTLTEFYSKNIKIPEISNYAFFQFLKIVFFYNIFMFNNIFFIQINGLSMGTCCGPTVANLYLYIHKPIIYKRFIDDIFIVSKELDINSL